MLDTQVGRLELHLHMAYHTVVLFYIPNIYAVLHQAVPFVSRLSVPVIICISNNSFTSK